MRGELGSEGLAQRLGELFNDALITLIPSPVAFFLGFDETGLLQNSHVMRDGGLGEVDAVFDITGAKADFFA